MTQQDVKLAWLQKIGDDSCLLRQAVIGKLGSAILDSAAVISGVLGSGGKLLIAGNGGSAADASHFAAEMVVRLTGRPDQSDRQALPAIALGTDPAVITAAANDFGFENCLARQLDALGVKGDMLFVISTSGNSQNLINAVKMARSKSILATGLLGNRGGKLARIVDRPLIVPHDSTQRIQEEHIFIIHLLVELVESHLFGFPTPV